MFKKIFNRFKTNRKTEDNTGNISANSNEKLDESHQKDVNPDIIVNTEKSAAKITHKFKISDNAPELQKEIIDATIETLKPLRFQSGAFTLLRFILVPDECENKVALSAILNDSIFDVALRDEVENALINQDTDWLWSFELGEKGLNVDFLGHGLYLGTTSTTINKNAIITAERGELKSESYTIKAEEGRVYNIGRGEYPILENKTHYINHIVIKDEPDFDDKAGENLKINMKVSRAHAFISWTKKGFYLKVLIGGSRLTENRTRILRRNEIIDVNNLELAYLLCDGDKIELGKSVTLNFKLLSN